MFISTKIQYIHISNKDIIELQKQAKLLGKWRNLVWQRYGSIGGLSKSKYNIVKELRLFDYAPLNSHIWAECVRDTVDNIKANMEATKELVKKYIFNRTEDEEERKRLFTLLKRDKWLEDPYLHRQMRKYWKRGHNKTYNQLVLDSRCYKITKGNNGKYYLRVVTLERRKFIYIPLSTNKIPSGANIRIILKDSNLIELHYAIKTESKEDHGDQTIGIDKGYTEAFVDSDGVVYGEGLGKLLSSESDYRNEKGKKRNKLYALEKKYKSQGKLVKANNIRNNNLTKKKLNNRKFHFEQIVKTLIYTAVHQLCTKAKEIVTEDLTFISTRKLGKNLNRRLSSWTKGLLKDAVDQVSRRKQVTTHYVNAAYTSQIDSSTLCFTGYRCGDLFYQESGDCIQADYNGARNVLSRKYDTEITRWMKANTVKSILEKRTEYHLELRRSNSWSSCNIPVTKNMLSTDSELVYSYK